MTKDEITSNLYGLRAGLSAISESADRVREYQNDIKLNEEKFANREKQVEEAQKAYEERCDEQTN